MTVALSCLSTDAVLEFLLALPTGISFYLSVLSSGMEVITEKVETVVGLRHVNYSGLFRMQLQSIFPNPVTDLFESFSSFLRTLAE
jgi:hypothetical protein